VSDKKVTIYTTPACVYCRTAKDFFTKHGVEYEEYDVLSDVEKREEMVKKSGQLGAPVIVVAEPGGREEVILGFDQPRLTALLGL